MYISEKQQKEITELINQFNFITEDGTKISRKSEIIMNNLYENYLDKIILGIIYTPMYSFWRYCDVQDLVQEARMAIYMSILKKQYDSKKGSPFNFFSTVTSNTLKNFTSKHNRHFDKKSSTDISKLYNNSSLTYFQDLDTGLIIDDVIAMLLIFFEDKIKFQNLTLLLAQYLDVNHNEKFVKKHFIQYAKGHNHSPAIVSTFFSYLKRFANSQQIKELLAFCEYTEGK